MSLTLSCAPARNICPAKSESGRIRICSKNDKIRFCLQNILFPCVLCSSKGRPFCSTRVSYQTLAEDGHASSSQSRRHRTSLGLGLGCPGPCIFREPAQPHLVWRSIRYSGPGVCARSQCGSRGISCNYRAQPSKAEQGASSGRLDNLLIANDHTLYSGSGPSSLISAAYAAIHRRGHLNG